MTSDVGRRHSTNTNETLSYAFCPPTSGDHYNGANEGPIRRDFYDDTSEQLPGGWIHNLEHGYVVALYSCGTTGEACPSPEEREELQRFFDEAPMTPQAAACSVPNRVLVARFDGIAAPNRFALVSWNRALLMESFDVETAVTFAQQNMDTTNPEPAC